MEQPQLETDSSACRNACFQLFLQGDAETHCLQKLVEPSNMHVRLFDPE